MSAKDRSHELATIVQAIKQRQGMVAKSPHPDRVRRSEFMRIAKSIQLDINNTFTKLEKLTLLARKRTLFDDRPVEIQELTYIIKQDISNLNQQIARLQQYQLHNPNTQGQSQQHNTNVVVSLQSRLATMSTSFKSVLETRTENLKQQQARKEQFSSADTAARLGPPPQFAAAPGNIGGVNDQQLRHRAFGDAQGNTYAAPDPGQGAVAIDMGNQYQQMQLMEQSNTYVQERSQAVDSINKTIAELGTIFTQLATMVHEQGQLAQRIDENILDAEMNIEGAHTELLKYFQSVSSNRWLMIKIFAVLIVFFVLFVVFLA